MKTIEGSRWRFPSSEKNVKFLDEAMRALYDAVDRGDTFIITVQAMAITDVWFELNQQWRAKLRDNSVFSSLPEEVDRVHRYTAVPMVAAWATMYAICSKYRLVDRDTGEIVRAPWAEPEEPEEIVVQGAWEDDGGAT